MFSCKFTKNKAIKPLKVKGYGKKEIERDSGRLEIGIDIPRFTKNKAIKPLKVKG